MKEMGEENFIVELEKKVTDVMYGCNESRGSLCDAYYQTEEKQNMIEKQFRMSNL